MNVALKIRHVLMSAWYICQDSADNNTARSWGSFSMRLNASRGFSRGVAAALRLPAATADIVEDGGIDLRMGRSRRASLGIDGRGRFTSGGETENVGGPESDPPTREGAEGPLTAAIAGGAWTSWKGDGGLVNDLLDGSEYEQDDGGSHE